MVTVALFAFLASWNEFFAPLILLIDGTKFTLPLAVVNMRTAPSARSTTPRWRPA